MRWKTSVFFRVVASVFWKIKTQIYNFKIVQIQYFKKNIYISLCICGVFLWYQICMNHTPTKMSVPREHKYSRTRKFTENIKNKIGSFSVFFSFAYFCFYAMYKFFALDSSCCFLSPLFEPKVREIIADFETPCKRKRLICVGVKKLLPASTLNFDTKVGPFLTHIFGSVQDSRT